MAHSEISEISFQLSAFSFQFFLAWTDWAPRQSVAEN